MILVVVVPFLIHDHYAIAHDSLYAEASDLADH